MSYKKAVNLAVFLFIHRLIVDVRFMFGIMDIYEQKANRLGQRVLQVIQVRKVKKVSQ